MRTFGILVLGYCPFGFTLAIFACGASATNAQDAIFQGRSSPMGPTYDQQPTGLRPNPPSVGLPEPSPSPSGSVPRMPNTVAIDMISPRPSAFQLDLQALGLDASRLPPIERLEPDTLRGVMKLMAKSLGIKCADCHREGDFAAPTRRKKIAVRMWNEFAVRLALADGSPLFCDSCHQGRVQQLDRRDDNVLSRWMDANFVAKLARKDGLTHDCETCHVDMVMPLLSIWGR